MNGLWFLSLALLLLSLVPSKQPKPLSAADEDDARYFYDDEEPGLNDVVVETTTETPKPEPRSHSTHLHDKKDQKIKKFTIQNIFKIDPPKESTPKPDPELRSFFTAANTAKTTEQKSDSSDIDMDALFLDLRREVPRVVTEILSRAYRLQSVISNEMQQSLYGGDDVGPLGRSASVNIDAKSTGEDTGTSAAWKQDNGLGYFKTMNGSEMEAALSEARAAISSVKRLDERMLRVLQGDDKCHYP